MSYKLNGLCYLIANKPHFIWTLPKFSGTMCPAKEVRYMQSIIEELYYGNVLPFERRMPKSGEYSHIMKLLTRNEEELLKTLTEAQKEIFEKFKANQAELNGIDEVTSFAIGFKIGLRLAAEAFVTAKPEQEPVNN